MNPRRPPAVNTLEQVGPWRSPPSPATILLRTFLARMWRGNIHAVSPCQVTSPKNERLFQNSLGRAGGFSLPPPRSGGCLEKIGSYPAATRTPPSAQVGCRTAFLRRGRRPPCTPRPRE